MVVSRYFLAYDGGVMVDQGCFIPGSKTKALSLVYVIGALRVIGV